MARIPNTDIPTKLPHAHIYLDQIQELEDLVKASFAGHSLVKSCSFQYTIDDGYKFSALDDLKEHKGKTSDFKMEIFYQQDQLSPTTLLRCNSSLAPIFGEPYALDKDARWALYSKVVNVLSKRKRTFKIATRDISNTTLTIVLLATIAVGVILLVLTNFTLPFKYGALVDVPFLSLESASIYGRQSNNYVYLSYFRPDELNRQAARREIVSKATWLIVGAAIGSVISGFVTKWILAHH